MQTTCYRMKDFSFCGKYLHATRTTTTTLFQYSQFGNMVLPTVLNNFKYVSFIRFSNEESELKTPNLNIEMYIFCLDSFIWLVGQFIHVKLTYAFTVCCLSCCMDLDMKHRNIIKMYV